MTNKRFNLLLQGPLYHPLPMFTITRLIAALHAVVAATGPTGEAALEQYCREREAQDQNDDMNPDPQSYQTEQ